MSAKGKVEWMPHEFVLKVKWQTRSPNLAGNVEAARAMRRAVAAYWRISENSVALEATLDGEAVPKLRKPIVRDGGP